MNAFWKSVVEKVLVAVVVAAILAIPFKQGVIYIVERLGPQAQVPVGTILAWNGKSKLPDGWAVCNGIDGTPDLKDRFLRGVREVAEAGKLEGEPMKATMDTLQSGPSHIGTVELQHAAKVLNVPLNYSVIYIIRTK